MRIMLGHLFVTEDGNESWIASMKSLYVFFLFTVQCLLGELITGIV